MNKFKECATCKKCGFDGAVYITYAVGTFDEVHQKNSLVYTREEVLDEYLIRTCNRCGYKWPEKCVDSEE